MGVRNFLNFILSLSLIYSVLITSSTIYSIFAQFSAALVAMRLAEWLMTNTRKYFLYKKVSSKNKAVLITGCDSGFGHMLAIRLDKLGFQVFAGCLNPKDDGAEELKKVCSDKLRVLYLDVTSDESVKEAKEFVNRNIEKNAFWALVNNAGLTQAAEIDWASLDEFRKVHEVNTFGMLRVTKEFLPMIKKAKGRIVNNSSICGRFICPGFVGYCMSKSAAIAFTTGLRVEMKKWGVTVVSIEPFFYRTPFTQEEPILDMIEKSWSKANPELQSEYGTTYKEAFKESCSDLLKRSSSKVQDVLNCFEDAIVSQEPMSTYFPCYLPDKVGLKLLFALPKSVTEVHQASLLARGRKPTVLTNNAKCRSKQIIQGS